MSGKRPVDASLIGEEEDDQKKEKKMRGGGTSVTDTDDSIGLRAWSDGADTEPSSTIHTLRCFWEGPSPPTPSRPYVLLEIDGRECLQRVIHSMLYHFGWNSDYTFKCSMPCRGELREGTVRSISVQKNSDTLPRLRKLVGSATFPLLKIPFGVNGAHLSLGSLSLQSEDEIKLYYECSGLQNKFVFRVEEVRRTDRVLPEVDLGLSYPTRSALLKIGKYKIRTQYEPRSDSSDEEDSDEEDEEEE
mmetsp:Transcript_45573/g.89032  ORF Transcript_45573/g.89032 Transcript_45573/m.89032 type:complete len:246 (+) Transcript_45573:107-844(+)|eukprot:CAMPEP_0194317872 /NCGR_PEP_ID=MMETSP0171-20130528/14566_1 /TAXON_ID=218684 /ORGANISM="Corethron pennatum, Strain L29A3" /LENGTH=245 /DNA_ID=CAMNT_0039074599 /DNA_START=86 /DNA_END=823 /DNA_ORIENTATION=+